MEIIRKWWDCVQDERRIGKRFFELFIFSEKTFRFFWKNVSFFVKKLFVFSEKTFRFSRKNFSNILLKLFIFSEKRVQFSGKNVSFFLAQFFMFAGKTFHVSGTKAFFWTILSGLVWRAVHSSFWKELTSCVVHVVLFRKMKCFVQKNVVVCMSGVFRTSWKSSLINQPLGRSLQIPRKFWEWVWNFWPWLYASPTRAREAVEPLIARPIQSE